jgi:hypothetical protein
MVRATLSVLMLAASGHHAPAGEVANLTVAVQATGSVLIEIPAEVRAAGDYVTLIPKTDAKAITYVGLSGIEPFPSEFLKDPRAFVLPVRGLPAGRYKFVAVGSLNDVHGKVVFSVFVGDAPPGPPDPGPTPVPVPPDDITASPLYKTVSAIYGADQSPTKAADKSALAGVYRSLARTAVPDPAVATAGDLARVAQAARSAAVGDRLAPVREVFGGDFEGLVPADPAAVLTPALKKEIATRLERYAGILGAIK